MIEKQQITRLLLDALEHNSDRGSRWILSDDINTNLIFVLKHVNGDDYEEAKKYLDKVSCFAERSVRVSPEDCEDFYEMISVIVDGFTSEYY
jgi:hypothetical protein|tara:strand:+ start:8707 stop:8982 length:276 start_codon:yes stop_codon:yes gene_type:complete